MDYTLDCQSGVVKLNVSRPIEFTPKGRLLMISYSYLPFSFQSYYRHKDYLLRIDSTTGRKKGIVSNAETSPLGNIFGNDLQKSGSIFRGFTVGSNRDLSLNSGFRLQFSGKLSSDVEIIAALTDENTPIQPEGNTQTIQELDNVYVQITSNDYEATLGDFYLDFGSGEFDRLSRKLQGAKGDAKYAAAGLTNSATLIGASSRGKYNTNQFSGIEGVQGPYRLYGKNNENNIIVIAGTEKVYVDGELMTRGETNDYAIDYSGSQITFSSKRLVTSASRIVVDFQYTDQAFTRNFVAAQSTSKTSGDGVRLSVTYAREGDDPNAPIDISLSDADKKLLRQSGSRQAVRSGVDTVGLDSLGLGRGQYAAIDTTAAGNAVRFYRFEPGTHDAVFNVSFSFVGTGRGDYVRDLLGQYRYVGPNNGSYLPIIILPSPQLQQVADINASILPTKDLTLKGEYAASNFDANRFSSGDDVSGAAMKFSADFAPQNVKVAGSNIGSFKLNLSERYVNKDFNSLDRVDEVEFGRKWSLDSTVKIQPSSEEIREAGISYTPIRPLSVGGSIGTNERGNQFSAERKEGFVKVAGDSLPSVDYTIEDIKSSAGTSASQNDWLRQRGSIEYVLHKVIPSFRFEREARSVETSVQDSLDDASFGFTTLAPKVSLKGIYGMNLSSELEVRDDNAALGGVLRPESRAITQSYDWTMPEVQNISASLGVILRKKSFEDGFRLHNGDVQTTLLRSQTRYTPFHRSVDADVFYEASTERSSRLQRVFYQVKKGEGQYVRADGNNTGPVDVTDPSQFQLSRFDGDYIIITVPSDQLYPVINVKTSSRLKLTPARFLLSPSTWEERALAAISTETNVRIEEKSSDPVTKDIYLLDLSHFLNPATTILGSQLFQQDLFLFENRPDLSFRFRYLQRKGAGIYSTGAEESYNSERSIRVRVQLVTEISNQIDYANKQDDLAASAVSGRSRGISSDDGSSDYSYRPEQNVEVGFKLEVSHSEDGMQPGPLGANFNAQSLRTVVSFQGSGQIRIDFSREEILLQNDFASTIVPYELTGGRSQGKTYLWGVSCDYRLSNNLQSSLFYTGRSEPDHPPIHTAKAEVRAFF